MEPTSLAGWAAASATRLARSWISASKSASIWASLAAGGFGPGVGFFRVVDFAMVRSPLPPGATTDVVPEGERLS